MEFPNSEPTTDEEVMFIRGLPYYAPRTAKGVAFCLDNGSSKEEIMKPFIAKANANDKEPIIQMLNTFIDFYLSKPERAKELFMPYSYADFSMSQY